MLSSKQTLYVRRIPTMRIKMSNTKLERIIEQLMEKCALMASTIEVIKKTIGGRIINGAFRAFSSLAQKHILMLL
jgi:hypothetical protein